MDESSEHARNGGNKKTISLEREKTKDVRLGMQRIDKSDANHESLLGGLDSQRPGLDLLHQLRHQCFWKPADRDFQRNRALAAVGGVSKPAKPPALMLSAVARSTKALPFWSVPRTNIGIATLNLADCRRSETAASTPSRLPGMLVFVAYEGPFNKMPGHTLHRADSEPGHVGGKILLYHHKLRSKRTHPAKVPRPAAPQSAFTDCRRYPDQWGGGARTLHIQHNL